MSYDWEEIVKTKSNKELYDIVVGRKVLSKDAVTFAKAELENRNFDFDNMEANRTAWALSSLLEEEHMAELEITGRKATHLSLRIWFIIQCGICLVYFVFTEFLEYDFPIGMVIFFCILATVFVLLNNYMARRQNQAHERRLQKMAQLKEKLVGNASGH